MEALCVIFVGCSLTSGTALAAFRLADDTSNMGFQPRTPHVMEEP